MPTESLGCWDNESCPSPPSGSRLGSFSSGHSEWPWHISEQAIRNGHFSERAGIDDTIGEPTITCATESQVTFALSKAANALPTGDVITIKVWWYTKLMSSNFGDFPSGDSSMGLGEPRRHEPWLPHGRVTVASARHPYDGWQARCGRVAVDTGHRNGPRFA
jgi:hypothetical protein